MAPKFLGVCKETDVRGYQLVAHREIVQIRTVTPPAEHQPGFWKCECRKRGNYIKLPKREAFDIRHGSSCLVHCSFQLLHHDSGEFEGTVVFHTSGGSLNRPPQRRGSKKAFPGTNTYVPWNEHGYVDGKWPLTWKTFLFSTNRVFSTSKLVPESVLRIPPKVHQWKRGCTNGMSTRSHVATCQPPGLPGAVTRTPTDRGELAKPHWGVGVDRRWAGTG